MIRPLLFVRLENWGNWEKLGLRWREESGFDLTTKGGLM